MSRIIQSPTKYIQGFDEIQNLAAYTKTYGQKPYLLMDAFLSDTYYDTICTGMREQTVPYYFELFQGECTEKEVRRNLSLLSAHTCDVIVAIGGGKVIDVGKAIAYFTHLPVIIVPTAASTDAPCSALSVLYHENGVLDRYLRLDSSPNLVLVDTHIILNAPARLLVAGMGDALSTYFEAAACYESGQKNKNPKRVSISALALAQSCLRTVLKDGLAAKKSCETKTHSDAFENIVEANIYLSGIGFESGGLAAAHAIHNGLTILPESAYSLHGEKIAYTTLLQLILEKRSAKEFQEILAFCQAVGLPTCRKDLKIDTISEESLFAVAVACTGADSVIHNMPFAVTPSDVVAAIWELDRRSGNSFL